MFKTSEISHPFPKESFSRKDLFQADKSKTFQKSSEIEIEKRLEGFRQVEKEIIKELEDFNQEINRLKQNYQDLKKSKINQVINYFEIKKIEKEFEWLLKKKLLAENKLREIREKISALEGKLDDMADFKMRKVS